MASEKYEKAAEVTTTNPRTYVRWAETLARLAGLAKDKVKARLLFEKADKTFAAAYPPARIAALKAALAEEAAVHDPEATAKDLTLWGVMHLDWIIHPAIKEYSSGVTTTIKIFPSKNSKNPFFGEG